MGTGYGYVYNAGDGYIRPDGINDYIDTQYGFPDAAFTVEVKFNYVNNGTHQYIMGAIDDNYHYVLFRVLNTSALRVDTRLSSSCAADICQSDDTLSDGEHTLHFVRETDGTPKLYIDGSEVASYSDQDAIRIPSLTAKQRICARSDGTSYPLASNVNWFAVYHAALSEARITANASLGNDMGLVGTASGDAMALAAAATSQPHWRRFPFGFKFGF